jgi:hypothetical protein
VRLQIKEIPILFLNPKYADLNAVREAVIPVLNSNGISVLQPIVHIEGKTL